MLDFSSTHLNSDPNRQTDALRGHTPECEVCSFMEESNMSLEMLTTSHASDQLAERVERIVQAKTGGRIRSLRIRIDEGCIVVSGQTSTYYNKQLATHAIRTAVDDMSVQNEVEVGR